MIRELSRFTRIVAGCNKKKMAVACLALALFLPGAACADSIEDQILDAKYRRGDYGFFMGWHDPQGVQFDEHGSYALPFGVKVRFRWLPWLHFEGDVSYYRRSGAPEIEISAFASPKFDGLMVGGTAQFVLARRGFVRPYAGVGGVIASLSNDFIVVRPNVPVGEFGREALATWRETDVGFQALIGLDIPIAARAFPFVEYRHLLGKVTVDEIRIGGLTPEFIGTPREDLETPSGDKIPEDYDWSGPILMGGLKIRF